MALFTYIPSKVYIEISGYKVQGHVGVSVSLDNPSFRTLKGIRGQAIRVRDTHTTGKLVITLLQTSPTNDLFSDIVQQDITWGTGRLTAVIKDESGSSLFFTDNAYLDGFPALDFSMVAGARVWTLNCLSIPTDQIVVGGNYKPALDLF